MQSNGDTSYDGSISQSSTRHSSSRHGVVLREDEVANLASRAEAYEDADDCGCHENGSYGPGHAAVSTIRKPPRYSLVLKEAISPLSSTQESSLYEQVSELSSGSYGHSPGGEQRRTTLNKDTRVIPPTNPTPVLINAPSQQSGQSISAFSEDALQLLSAPSVQVMLTRTSGSSRSTSLSQGEVSSRGVIPRTVLEQHDTSFANDVSLQTSQLVTAGLDVKYSMLVAMVLSASLVILNV
jgi:hypothetical protein